MTARDAAGADRDWWTPHVLIAIFGLLVAVLLRLVPGWSVPLHAWIALTGLVLAALVAHAGVRAATQAMRRRWRDALSAALLAAGLAAGSTLLMLYGRSHGVTIADNMIETPAAPAAGPR